MVAVALCLIVLAVTVPWWAAHHVARLPYAPECPCCKAVTGQTARHGVMDRFFAVLAATPVRTCARCGWAGRMRWRVAAERAHPRGHAR